MRVKRLTSNINIAINTAPSLSTTGSAQGGEKSIFCGNLPRDNLAHVTYNQGSGGAIGFDGDTEVSKVRAAGVIQPRQKLIDKR